MALNTPEEIKAFADSIFTKWEGDLFSRMDTDRNLVNLAKYELKDVNGNKIPNSISITLNDPATFAWKVETYLNSAVEQVSVTAKNKRFDTAYIEEFIRACFTEADKMLTKKGLWPFNQFVDQQTCRRGRAAARVFFQVVDGKLIPDILPYDVRYSVYWYGVGGLDGWDYTITKSNDQIISEYPDTDVPAGDTDVSEILTRKAIITYIGNKPKVQPHKLEYVPVCYQPVSLGSMLQDPDTRQYQGESIFFLIRDLLPELNRLVSIIQSINLKALDRALQLRISKEQISSTMKLGTVDEVTAPGKVNGVPSDGGYDLMPIGKLEQDADRLRDMIERRVSDAMSRFILQDPTTPKTATEIIANLQDRDLIIAPRLVTRALLKQQIAEMFISQVRVSGESTVTVDKRQFDVAKLTGDYQIEYKYSFKDSQAEIARTSMAASVRGLLPDYKIRREILQREDPDEDEELLRWEEAERLSPLVKMDRTIRSLLKQADDGMPGAEQEAQVLAVQFFSMLRQALAGTLPVPEAEPVKPSQPLVPVTTNTGASV